MTLRRGRLTCHKAYNDATAILAGDALQALAFQVLAQDPGITVSAEQRLRMIDTLALAAGPGRHDRRAGHRPGGRRTRDSAWKNCRTCTRARPAH